MLLIRKEKKIEACLSEGIYAKTPPRVVGGLTMSYRYVMETNTNFALTCKAYKLRRLTDRKMKLKRAQHIAEAVDDDKD